MRLDKLTVKSREAFGNAESLARRRGNQEITEIHLLLAFLESREGITRPVLGRLGVLPDILAKAVSEAVDKLPKVSGGKVYISGGLARLIDEAGVQADAKIVEAFPPFPSAMAMRKCSVEI